MRNFFIGSILTFAAVLLFTEAALAQVTDIPPGPGWLPAVRRHSFEAQQADRKKYIDGHKLDPHDLTGVWGENGVSLNMKTLPPFTPYGKELSDATQAEMSPAGFAIESSKDPQQICDPMGFPRLFSFNYGFEFAQLPGKLIEFFEWGHTWRTIFTDGRKLPPDPPQDRYMGYAVGRWEGDTFIVESSGFDDRSWIGRDSRNGERGLPHSNEMRIVERYKRPTYDTLEVTITITDPKVFTAPWTSSGKVQLYPGTEIGEYFCVPSDERDFQNLVSRPAAGAEPIKEEK